MTKGQCVGVSTVTDYKNMRLTAGSFVSRARGKSQDDERLKIKRKVEIIDL